MKPKKLVFENGVAKTPIGDYELISNFKDGAHFIFRSFNRFYTGGLMCGWKRKTAIQEANKHYKDLVMSNFEGV